MKTAIKNNKVKVNRKGNFLMIGLSKEAKKSLKELRNDLLKSLDKSIIDSYIIPLYDKESNDIYFVTGESYSNDERAEILG